MLARAQEVIDEASAEQLLEVQERLRNRNVDWSTGSNIIQPVALEVEMNPASGRVHVGDTVEFAVSATNEGSRPLHQVRAVSRSDYSIFDDHEFVFGRLDPGQSATWTVSVAVSIEEPTRFERVSFRALADRIALDADVETFVEVVGRERPRWGFTYYIDDASGNADGILNVGEQVRFVMDITNTGAGAADETVIYLRNHSDAAIFLTQGRDSLEGLDPGETYRSVFEFEVHEVPESGFATVEAAVYDSVFREFLSEQLEIEVVELDAEREIEVRSHRAAPREGALQIRGAAAEGAPVIARLDEGSLPVTAYVDGFYRVDWDEGSGWVREGDAEISDPVAIPPSAITPLVAFQAPEIRLDHDILRTDEATFELRGAITDDTTVRDYYVVISNRLDDDQTQSLKVTYQHLGVPSATISEEIELRPGTNRITVFARDEHRVTSSQVLFVYRDG